MLSQLEINRSHYLLRATLSTTERIKEAPFNAANPRISMSSYDKILHSPVGTCADDN